MTFLDLWWPFGRPLPQRHQAETEQPLLRYGQDAKLFDLQPSILRWLITLAVLSILYSIGQWFPPGTPRSAFSVTIGILWALSLVMTVVLVLLQERRRRALTNGQNSIRREVQ